MTQTILERVQQYIALSATIQPDWWKFVNDKTQPLDDRWEAFLAAPSDWRRKHSDGDVPLSAAQAKLSSPYDDFRMELGETKDVVGIFDYLGEFVDDGKLTEEEFVACQEEAIEINLGSWKYDH